MIPDGELGSVEAAEALGITDRQVRNLVKEGILKPDRIKKTKQRTFYYFKPETIEVCKQQRSGEAPTIA